MNMQSAVAPATSPWRVRRGYFHGLAIGDGALCMEKLLRLKSVPDLPRFDIGVPDKEYWRTAHGVWYAPEDVVGIADIYIVFISERR